MNLKSHQADWSPGKKKTTTYAEGYFNVSVVKLSESSSGELVPVIYDRLSNG